MTQKKKKKRNVVPLVLSIPGAALAVMPSLTSYGLPALIQAHL